MTNKCAHAGLPPTKVRCPVCKKGTMEVARGRFGPIYKCTNKFCKHWMPERPTGKKCSFDREGSICGALLVNGTKTIPERCSDKNCPNRYPHKLWLAKLDLIIKEGIPGIYKVEENYAVVTYRELLGNLVSLLFGSLLSGLAGKSKY